MSNRGSTALPPIELPYGATLGDIARKHIHDPELLRFIDMECYVWSTVPATMTPMISTGMVM
jgi:hypothetical protein